MKMNFESWLRNHFYLSKCHFIYSLFSTNTQPYEVQKNTQSCALLGSVHIGIDFLEGCLEKKSVYTEIPLLRIYLNK